MEKRALGKNGPLVSALGLGCMGMSDFYGPRDEAESLATLNHALDRGVDFLDTADMYGFGENEELLAKLLRTRRREVFLATKFGFIRDRADPGKRAVSGRADYVKAACDASLRRLGTDVIDLYYAHRIDATIPIEETVGAMADLVRAGKVRHLGLSEAGPYSLRRASAVHPSPPCKASIRYGRATSRTACSACAASWASPSSPTARSAAAFSRASSRASPTSRPTTSAARSRASRATISPAISNSSST